MASTIDQVQEMQGLYGPFTIAERVVQKIWLRSDFDTRELRLQDGRKLAVLRPGAWNLMAGPDFRGARLVIDGREITGDVEVHFHASDWRAHGHETDRAYDNVVLHVVMFPPSDARAVARSHQGEPLPTLVLLPLLNRGLEEYASDDALEGITARDTAEKIAELSLLPPPELQSTLRRVARERWDQKMRFASLRIKKLGWTAAAHHTALEILGYRHNRAPMLAVASRHPLETWVRPLDLDGVYRESYASWQTQGSRPANHPRRRLQQYAAWAAACPDWPERWRALGSVWPLLEPDGESPRAGLDLSGRRDEIVRDLLYHAIGGSRLDNLICDGLLPLLSADAGRDLWTYWFHWYLGDAPTEVRKALGTLGMSHKSGLLQSHGWAQGLLGWIIERDLRAST